MIGRAFSMNGARTLGTLTLGALLLAGQLGCYNTYKISWDEMAKLQEGGDNAVVRVKINDGTAASAPVAETAEGAEQPAEQASAPTGEPGEGMIDVTANTKIGVTEKDGSYHQISPFNFTMTQQQLVAPDEDLLLLRSEIETGNVKQVSGTKTALLVAAGVAILAGGVIYVVSSAEEADTFGQ